VCEAFKITRDQSWFDNAVMCFNWFLGHNDLNLPLYDAKTGGCRDGLMADGINQNEGAESSLAWLLRIDDLAEALCRRDFKPAVVTENRLTKGSVMHIAMLSPIAWRTPPRHYGPWENVASLLTEGLVSRGHDVTLFATADSQTSGRLHAVCPQGYEENRELIPKVWECLHISELFEHGDEYDIIHNHFDYLPLTYTGLTNTPVVTTIHGFSSPGILPVYKKYNSKARIMFPSAMPIDHRNLIISKPSITASISGSLIFSQPRTTPCFFSGAFTMTREPEKLLKSPGPAIKS
jgi:hypothetical protein